MVKNFLSRANKPITISKAAALIAGSYFGSAILGLMRDRLLAARFGLGGTLDSYFAAFSIPDLLFYLLVSGALAVTFIPVISEKLINHDKKAAWEVSYSVLNFLALVTLVASVLIFIFASPLMWLVAPKFDLARHQTAVELTRIIALNPFFFSLSTVFGSLQQAFGRFLFYAFAPIFYNVGIIIGVVVLSPHYGIKGVAIGVVIGSVLQMLVQRLGLVGLGFEYRRRIHWRNQSFRQIIKLMIPRSIDEGVENLQGVIERAIASGLAVGSIAAYQYAFNLKNMPIALIGVAISTATFPKISETVAQKRTDLLKQHLVKIIQVMLWLVIPTALLFVILRGYIVRLLFGFGSPIAAGILGWFAGAIIFQSMHKLVGRVFYAHQDTKTPLYVSIVALVLNVALALWFVHWFGIRGLAMATSVVAIFEATTLFIIMRRRLGSFTRAKDFWLHIAKISIASLAAASVAYILVRYAFPLLHGETGFWRLAPKFTVIGASSALAYIAAGWCLRLAEARIVINKTLQILFKPQRIE